jgi:tetratricopeptide (TPR) repeat protein
MLAEFSRGCGNLGGGVFLMWVFCSSGLWAQTTSPPPPQRIATEEEETPSDTLAGVKQISRLLRTHYNPGRGGFAVSQWRLEEWDRVDLSRDPYCNGGQGSFCHGGDPDHGPCRDGASCHPTSEFLVEKLTEAAVEYPTSNLILGQAIYALTKFNFTTRAYALADQCQAEDWFCDALFGYVLNAQGRPQEAEPYFRSALEAAPIPEFCSFGNALWLLGDWSQQTAGSQALPEAWERTEELPCLDLVERSDTLFWWADPLYAVEGNERWVEHMSRAFGLRLYKDLREIISSFRTPQDIWDLEWALRIRRGVWDSYRNTNTFTQWTSEEKALYHFFPDVDPEDISDPQWNLDSTIFDEGFTPVIGPFSPIRVQLARFRKEGDLLLAAVGKLTDTPLEGATDTGTFLFLTDGPGSLPLQLSGRPYGDRAIFLGQAPQRDYVLSLEAISSQGIGRHRSRVLPLGPEGPGISDLLLFQPSSTGDPKELLEAVALMLGEAAINKPDHLGVYWETYGSPPRSTIEFELSLQRENRGLGERISGLLPGGTQEGVGSIRWSEESSGDPHPGVITLDLTSLRPGDYEIILQVRWAGQEVLERRGAVEVRNPKP